MAANGVGCRERGVSVKVVTGTPPALEEALAAEVAAAQADDPLAPVGVLLGGTLQRPTSSAGSPSPERRDRQRPLPDAERAGDGARRAGAGRSRASGRCRRSPTGSSCARSPPSTTATSSRSRTRPGLADAFHRLVRELRGAGYDGASLAEGASRAPARSPSKEEAIGEIFAEFLERREGFYGPDDCLLAAEPERAPWEALFVFGLWQAPAELVDDARRARRADPGDGPPAHDRHEDVDSAHADLRAALLDAGAEPRASSTTPSEPSDRARTPPAATSSRSPTEPAPDGRLAQAALRPDPAREVREVARQCLAWAREGIRFHEMAIAYRHPDPYRSLIESVFREAGIPVYLHEGTPMSERPLGRRVIALLELIDSDFERRAVMDFLTDGRLPEATREHYGDANASTLGPVLARAPASSAASSSGSSASRPTPTTSQRATASGSATDAPKVDAFLQFIRDLHRDLADHPETATWSEHLAALDALLRRYVDEPEPILDALAGLGRFDALGDDDHPRALPPGGHRRRSRTSAPTRSSAASPGAFGLRGVNVLDVNSLRHLRFRAVAIVGLAERSFPAAAAPDPILLDHERERLNAKGPAPIPLRVRGADPEPLQFALATYAARERLLASYPRKGAGRGAPAAPLALLPRAGRGRGRRSASRPRRSTTSRPSSTSALAGAASAPASSTSRSAPRSTTAPCSSTTSTSAAPRSSASSPASPARSRRARPALRSKLTEFDGVLGPEAREQLAKVFDPARRRQPLAARELRELPAALFLGNVLGAREDDEPEAIDPPRRGRPRHPDPPGPRALPRPRAGARARSGSTAPARRSACSRSPTRSSTSSRRAAQTGYPAIWARRPPRAERGPEGAGSRTSAGRAAPRELSEGAYEVRFGYGWGDDPESDGGLSSDDPIEITAGKVKLKVSGRIDRLNWDPDKRELPGRRLQDRQAWDKPEGRRRSRAAGRFSSRSTCSRRRGCSRSKPAQGEAEYHYSTRRGGFERGRFTGADFAARKADLEAILAEMLARDATRASSRWPSPSDGDCSFCVADRLCPTVAACAMIERKARRRAEPPDRADQGDRVSPPAATAASPSTPTVREEIRTNLDENLWSRPAPAPARRPRSSGASSRSSPAATRPSTSSR